MMNLILLVSLAVFSVTGKIQISKTGRLISTFSTNDKTSGQGNYNRPQKSKNFAKGLPIGIAYNYGEAVMTGQVNIYHIYYGNWLNDSMMYWNINNTGRLLIEDFARNIGKSEWYNTNRQYYYQKSSNSSRIYVSKNVVFKGGLINNYSLGPTLDYEDFDQIVREHIKDFNGGIPDANGIYFVLTSPDVSVNDFCDSYCGWHSYLPVSSTTVKYSFVGVPKFGCNCFGQYNSPNKLSQVEAMLTTYAHELVETVSDPELKTWRDMQGMENADKCSWNWGNYYYTGSYWTGFYNAIVGSKKYLIQTNWDPTTGSCEN